MALDPYFNKVASLLPFDSEATVYDPLGGYLVGCAELTSTVSAELGTAFTIVGAPVIATVAGRNAMLLNGTSMVYFTLSGSMNTVHTIRFEVYIAALGAEQAFLVSDASTAGDDIMVGVNAARAWKWREQNAVMPTAAGATIGWHEVEVSFDGANTRLYVDGVRVATGTCVAGAANTIIQLGRMSTTYVPNGTAIRKVRAYRTAVAHTDPSYVVSDVGAGRFGDDVTGKVWFDGGAPTIEDGALVLDGSSYLYAAGFQFGTADFTIEGRFAAGSTVDWPRLVNQAGTDAGLFWLDLSPERRLCLVAQGATSAASTRTFGLSTVDGGQHHIAVVRKGNAVAVFLDGVAELAMPIYGSVSSANRFALGTVADNLGGVSNFIGTADDVRITIGKARYAFTLEPYFYNTVFIERPAGPSFPFSNNNRNKTITQANAASILEEGPFGGTDYMLRLNGTSSYASIPTHADFNFGAGDFTVEWWGKNSLTNGAQCVLSSGVTTYMAAGTVAIYQSANHVRLVTADGGNPTINVLGDYSVGWHHFVIERIGGVARIYIDGVLSASVAYASAINFGTTRTYFGRSGWSAAEYYNGDITDLRLTKGIARYDADFTPSRIVEVTGSFTPPPVGSLPIAATAISGTVVGSDNNPCQRTVFAYSHENGSYLGTAVSDPVTGAFSIAVPERAFAVCLDDDISGQNALVLDRLDPV